MDDGIDAELRGAEVRDGTLYLDYTVVNRSAQFLQLGGPLPRNALHTSLEPGPVLLVRRPLSATSVEIPPGGSFSETLELPLPVPPRHPIAPQPEGPRHEVDQVALAFDYRLDEQFIGRIAPARVSVLTTISAP